MLEVVSTLGPRPPHGATRLSPALTTFLTMAMIIFVNPIVMADAGIDLARLLSYCLASGHRLV